MRLTKKGLINRAKAGGFDPSLHLVDDWVDRGLLDRPHRKGRGRGKGVASYWPDEQVQLLLLLLQKRDELDGRSLKPLYNIPVALWLFWGDRYASSDQVHRALKSWLKGSERTAIRSAKRYARQYLSDIEHPDTNREDRELAFEELYRAIRGEGDLRYLRKSIGWLFDPQEEGRTIGPSEAPMTSQNVVRLIEARLLAWQNIGSITPRQLELARISHNQALIEYHKKRPALAQDPDLGHIYQSLTLDQVVNTACVDLLTVVGLGLLISSKPDPDDQAPDNG